MGYSSNFSSLASSSGVITCSMVTSVAVAPVLNWQFGLVRMPFRNLKRKSSKFSLDDERKELLDIQNFDSDHSDFSRNFTVTICQCRPDFIERAAELGIKGNIIYNNM